MKKLLCKLIFAILFLFPIRVLAAGNISVSPGSLTIEQGSSKTFTITAYNTIGDVSISSSNAGVVSVSTGEWGTGMVEEGQNKSGSITVYGNSIGTATITLTIDAATFDGDDLAGQTRTVIVNVIAKQVVPEQPQTPQKPNNNTNQNIKTDTKKNTNNKSSNNNIKEISVDNFELTKIDNNNYSLTINSNITSVNINAVAEDSKAIINGTGIHELSEGENNIELVVTAENGLKNVINVKVIRVVSHNNDSSLAKLVINKKTINLINDVYNYDLTINSNVKKLDIKAVAKEDTSNIVIEGNENIINGSKVLVKVTAEDGSETIYTINCFIKDTTLINIVMIILTTIAVTEVINLIVLRPIIRKKIREASIR